MELCCHCTQSKTRFNLEQGILNFSVTVRSWDQSASCMFYKYSVPNSVSLVWTVLSSLLHSVAYYTRSVCDQKNKLVYNTLPCMPVRQPVCPLSRSYSSYWESSLQCAMVMVEQKYSALNNYLCHMIPFSQVKFLKLQLFLPSCRKKIITY